MSSKPPTPRGINHDSVQKLILQLASQYNCPQKELAKLIETALAPLPEKILGAMKLKDIKTKVAIAWGKRTYKELSKDKEWKIYHKSTEMNASLRTTWETYYREWVGLSEDEKNLQSGPGIVNGIDIFKNFRHWEVFNLDRKISTAADVKAAFRKLSFKYHPDLSTEPDAAKTLNKLIEMRDALLIAL